MAGKGIEKGLNCDICLAKNSVSTSIYGVWWCVACGQKGMMVKEEYNGDMKYGEEGKPGVQHNRNNKDVRKPKR